MRTITWKVYTLDVWGNQEDGYDINDYFPSGSIETSDEAPAAEVWCALLEAGIARGNISRAKFEFYDDFIEIREVYTDKPVFHLDRVEV